MKTWFEKAYVVLLLVIFGGIVLHAPLSVGFGVLFPDYDLLIKSWKEILMGAAGLLLIVILSYRQQWSLLKKPIVLLIAGFALLHILTLLYAWRGVESTLAGVLIDLRYLLYFVFVYVAVTLYPSLRRPFLLVGGAGALLVTVFAVLQVTVLPYDVLKYIGYSKETITPYLTVDQNTDFIRVNSTLRGPNPLGAFAGMALTLLLAYIVRGRLKKANRPQVVAGVLAATSVVSIWVSYSRSAWIGALIGIVTVFVLAYGRNMPRKVWYAAAAGLIVVVGLLVIFQRSDFVSNVIFHNNLNGGASVDSNEGHASSLQQAIRDDLAAPLGTGIGSTGSASLLGDSPTIVENQYLFQAHEAGILSLIVFVAIYVLLLKGLWRKRQDWLALGMFASGLGLAVIGLLLPVWADDTVSIVWWGLAAVAFAGSGVVKSKHHGRAKHKKTA